MTLKIETLRCFCTVAETGNLADAADAADRLGRTQAAISMTLKQLEDQLGSPLFEGTRKNRLSALGEQVFTLGRHQLRQLDSTIQAIKDSASAPQGLLRIAAVPSVAALIYPPIVEFLTGKHPGLHLELRDMDTHHVIDALVQQRADIGIASTYQVLNGIEAAPLFQDSFGLVCSVDHPLAQRGGGVRISDVLEVPFLRNPLCDHIETVHFREGLETVHLLIHNTNSLLAMVRTGKWVTVLPKSVMESAAADLRFQPITGLPDERQVTLYQRRHKSAKGVHRDAYTFISEYQWAANK